MINNLVDDDMRFCWIGGIFHLLSGYCIILFIVLYLTPKRNLKAYY